MSRFAKGTVPLEFPADDKGPYGPGALKDQVLAIREKPRPVMDPRLAPIVRKKKVKSKGKADGPSSMVPPARAPLAKKAQPQKEKGGVGSKTQAEKKKGEKRKEGETRTGSSSEPLSPSEALRNLAKGRDAQGVPLNAVPKPQSTQGRESSPAGSPARPSKVVEVCSFLEQKKRKSLVSPVKTQAAPSASTREPNPSLSPSPAQEESMESEETPLVRKKGRSEAEHEEIAKRTRTGDEVIAPAVPISHPAPSTWEPSSEAAQFAEMYACPPSFDAAEEAASEAPVPQSCPSPAPLAPAPEAPAPATPAPEPSVPSPNVPAPETSVPAPETSIPETSIPVPETSIPETSTPAPSTSASESASELKRRLILEWAQQGPPLLLSKLEEVSLSNLVSFQVLLPTLPPDYLVVFRRQSLPNVHRSS